MTCIVHRATLFHLDDLTYFFLLFDGQGRVFACLDLGQVVLLPEQGSVLGTSRVANHRDFDSFAGWIQLLELHQLNILCSHDDKARLEAVVIELNVLNSLNRIVKAYLVEVRVQMGHGSLPLRCRRGHDEATLLEHIHAMLRPRGGFPKRQLPSLYRVVVIFYI